MTITRARFSLLVVCLGLIAACESPALPPPAAVLPLGKLRAAYLAGPDTPFGVGLSKVFTGGFPPGYFIASSNEIHIASAYTDGRQTAYMTTDIWVNFPEVWLQPLYIFVSAWDDKAPSAHWLDLPWVAGVGPDSAFWSPFWQVYYVVVPAGTPVDRYRSVRAIVDAKLPIYPGPGRLMTIVPDGGMQPEPADRILLPQLRDSTKVGLPPSRAVWIDGRANEASGLDFGEDRFEWNQRDEIIDQPLYFFFTQSGTGDWVPVTSVPRVGGTGAPFANAPARAPGNRPVFGSFWRLWGVHLPATARVFVPPARRAEWEGRNEPWRTLLPVAEPPASFAASVDLDAHAFKVMLNDDCLTRAGAKPEDLASCPWLDSQRSLETYLPAALIPSEIVVTCPYMSFNGAAVPPPTP